MLNFALPEGVNTSSISEKEKKEIKLLIKSYFAQNIYGDEYFYKLYLQIDDDVQKVLKTKEL